MPDWDDFVRDIIWFLRDEDKVEHLESDVQSGWIPPSPAFQQTFPTLTQFLMRSRLSKVRVNDKDFHLYGWTKANGDSLGWLCQPPVRGEIEKDLHPHHKLLLSGLGGITERWNEPESSWLLNYDYAFGEDKSDLDACAWDESYRYFCQLHSMEPVVDCRNYTEFAQEANGNFMVYHKETAEVLMYAHDHYFQHITILEGCPECIWYRVNDCTYFVEWVETLAAQWSETITNSDPAESRTNLEPLPGLVSLRESTPVVGTMLYRIDGSPAYILSGLDEWPQVVGAEIELSSIGNPKETFWQSFEVSSRELYWRRDSVES